MIINLIYIIYYELNVKNNSLSVKMISLIYVTTNNEEEATFIGEIAVKERLAACANIVSDMKSIYWWEGNLEKDNESILILKTIDKNVEDLINRIKEIHSYDNPCIIALPISNAFDSYLEWIKNETI
jgi:periplasmic divalent cation tolerance protein